MPGAFNYTAPEPVGVVAVLFTWNGPTAALGMKLAPILAAGCTIVLKASEDAPGPVLAFARLVDEAGFPPGVVNIITGFGPECGATLTSHPHVSRIAFTGGPETARHVVRNSAENLAAVSLELGGKSPVVVFDDADIESAANAVVAGIFAASGQSCVAGSRLLVQRGLKDALLQRLADKAARIRIGDPHNEETEFGPLATLRQRDRIERVVAESVAAGARIVAGGKRPPGLDKGYYYLPTILDCSGVNSPSAEQELFGPVLSVLTFDGEGEAVTLANDNPYGLAAGVFTRDLTRAHRLVRSIRAGIVWVNTYRAISPIAPFGGYGLSGYGREGGFESVLDYTRTKSVWLRTSDDPIPDPFVMR
jgi:aldehyde dehydrogenase (NAD+)/betaine-aldehyde dehydrogenase